MENQPVKTAYQQQIKKHQIYLQELLRKRTRLGWARFFVFIATIITTYKVFVAAGIIGFAPVVIGIGILLFLVSVDVNNNQKVTNVKTLLQINEEELQVLNNDYYDRYDGSQYAPDLHNYANDIDLFGKASIFQWSNRCQTEQGRSLLAQNLLRPLPVDQIKERHEAVKEIAPQIEWRQQLQALSMQTTITKNTEQKTAAWLNEEEKYFTNKRWKIIVQLYSVITIASIIAAILGYISATTFSGLYILYFFTSIILSRNTLKPYIELSGIAKEMDVLHKLVTWIEDKDFQSSLLQKLQQEAKADNQKAATQIRELKQILDRFDMRLNMVGPLFLNTFLLWDVRQMIALNEWRKRNKNFLSKWYVLIAETEVLHSLACIHFNEPVWPFPEFSNQHFTFDSTSLGHPLIPSGNRITSDFGLEGIGKIGLVTGSNMAGKSTFLRSLGVNIVLAQLGAPVCAKTFLLSPVHLMSSMRIADNLAENTSTFYAELKKLKTIIEAVNLHEKIFILLDEILRGTNSFDRHTGSEALMKQLIKENAVAVIATHDVELAALEQQYPNAVENYHFDVQVEGEELFFDYKLKHGVCTSLNASILMKKIGIELQ
ncbi:MAG: MutS-related protein [Flavisolibacter sp.]